MKKFIVTLIVSLVALSVANAQTVVVERPGIFTDLSTALVGIPAAAATGIVQGVVEAGRELICGSTVVVSTPAPRQVVVSTPVVTVPSTSVVTTTPAPYVIPGAVVVPQPTTQIITNYGNGTSVVVTRPASSYELGGGVVYPAAPGHRVGPSPFVNPYIHRPGGF